MIRISVIIPEYNLENYIAQCIESCIGQTLGDIEIICVNDGSKDQSLQILQQFASNDSRIRIVDIPNEGVVHARETGIAQATGEYVTFIDGDDYIPLNALEILYNKAVETNADIVNSTVAHLVGDKKTLIVRGNALQTREEFIRGCFRNQDFYLHARLFKRELFAKRALICPPEISHNEDAVMLASLFFLADTIVSCSDEGYYYIFRSSSASGSISDQKSRHILKARKIILNYFRKEGFWEQYQSELLFFMLIALFNIVIYGNAKKVLSKEDIKYLSLKNLFYGQVSRILKMHLSRRDYWLVYVVCTFPNFFIHLNSILKRK